VYLYLLELSTSLYRVLRAAIYFLHKLSYVRNNMSPYGYNFIQELKTKGYFALTFVPRLV